MSRLVFFSALAVTLLACEPAKTPTMDGGDAAVVDAGPAVAPPSASMTVVAVKSDAGLPDAGKPVVLDAGSKPAVDAGKK